MDKFSVPTTEKRSLRYDFTAVEIHDLSLALASKTKEVTQLTEEKKSVVSQWTAKVNEAKATCNSLSFKVSDGFEYRDIECEVILNQPSQGKKTVIRKDDNRLVGVEEMSKSDWDKLTEERTLFPLDETLTEPVNTEASNEEEKPF
jgi:rRNA processing protein Krr1/Pno1